MPVNFVAVLCSFAHHQGRNGDHGSNEYQHKHDGGDDQMYWGQRWRVLRMSGTPAKTNHPRTHRSYQTPQAESRLRFRCGFHALAFLDSGTGND